MPYIGAVIGQYHIVEQLGEGGMAVVFKAYHTGLERYRAIKFIRPEVALVGSFRARFNREARDVAGLSEGDGASGHPNIVRVFDEREHDGRFYRRSDSFLPRRQVRWVEPSRARRLLAFSRRTG